MKIILIIEDGDNGVVQVDCLRQNNDGTVPAQTDDTPANNIARILERSMQECLGVAVPDSQKAARCWH